MLLAASAWCEQHAPLNAPAQLERANKAWNEAKALGPKVHAALKSGGPAYLKLLDEQAALYETAEQAFSEALHAGREDPYVLADYGLFAAERRKSVQARMLLDAAVFATRKPAGKDDAGKPLPEPPRLTAEKEALVCRALGGLLERSGDNARACSRYRDAYRLWPGDPKNRLSLAIGLCALGQPHEALSLLKPWADEAAKKADTEPLIAALALYTLALAEEETGYPEDALAHYRQARERAMSIDKNEGDNLGIADRAGLGAARLEDYFDSMQERSKNRAAENAARAEKKLPPLPDERENYINAAQLCDQGVRLKEQSLEDENFRIALSKARRNSANITDDDLSKQPAFETFAAGMQALQAAIRRGPRMPRPYLELASCNVMLGRFGAARKLLEEAAGCSPNSLAILHLYGEVLLELGQWEDALRVFTSALGLEQESGRANLGMARACAGLRSDARQCQAGLDALDRAEQLGVRENAELRAQLADALRRFERGEKPEPRKVIKGSGSRKGEQPTTPNVWSGTIFDK
jgi:predicted Zn-dependent protease